MTQASPIVEASEVRYDYGQHTALGGLTFAIEPGITGVLGLNGVGKTTLLKLVATVTTPSAGSVRVLGTDTGSGNLTSLRRQLGYLPQDASWPPHLRVRAFLELFAWMRHIPSDEVAGRVAAALARTHTEHLATRKLSALSGGEHRRVMLAQALLHEPRLLVLDEPTAGLDPQQRAEFREMLRELSSTTSTIISTHLLEDVATLADQLLVVHDGRLAFQGRPSDLAGDASATATELEAGFMRVIGTDA